MARKYDLVICGYYGFDNLGDELICLALIEMALEAGLKKDRICVLSSDPRKTKSRFGVASVNRWNILEVLNALRQSRSFLLGGGGFSKTRRASGHLFITGESCSWLKWRELCRGPLGSR